MTPALVLAALAAAQPAAPPGTAQPDLDWLAGYWLSCEDGRDVSETWSVRRGGVMLGFGVTIGPQAFSWEQMRIETAVPDPAETSFIAQPRSAERPTAFRLIRAGPGEAVFENPDHDFPRRVIYRREGDSLHGRIESADGFGYDWHYRAAPLNTRCPR
jgi:hypothetical protein